MKLTAVTLLSRQEKILEALFTITKIMKQPKRPSVDEWIEQLWDIYAMEYYSSIKKKKNVPFETVWVDLENIC